MEKKSSVKGLWNSENNNLLKRAKELDKKKWLPQNKNIFSSNMKWNKAKKAD